MDEFIVEILFLQLESLDDNWVQEINYSEYLEYSDIPSEYEDAIRSLDIPKLFRNLIQFLKNWQNDDEEPIESKSWLHLNRLFPYNKLLALLGFYINNGTKKVIKKEDRNKAIMASRLYYKLLSIPSYKSYHIYHSQLFVNSLACLSFPKAMCDKAESFSSIDLIRQINSVIKELIHFLGDLKVVIQDLQLTPNDLCFEDVLSNLVDICGGAIFNKLNIDKIELNKLSTEIYEILNMLICDSQKQPSPVAIRLLFKCVLPKLIAACDTRNNIVRAAYVAYTGVLVNKYKKVAVMGFIVLLQHICYTLDGLERAEVRSARVILVHGLMSFLSQKSHRKMVKWVIQLSETAKNPHRHLSMEILAKLLNCEPHEADFTEDLYNMAPDSTTEEETENTVENMENTVNEGNSANAELINGDVFQIKSDGEEEVVRPVWKPLTVPLIEMLRAIYNRTDDTSSALRARALAILCDCVASRRPHVLIAIEKLNASGAVRPLSALAVRSVIDERAVVRRAGVSLLHKLLEQGPPPQPADLQILKGLCRDASIIVRSAAINALAEMIGRSPTDGLIDAFLTGPMHQISDPESRVQEQVLTLVQQLIIDRLKMYSAISSDDNLPWLLLAGIIRNNMRRHLQKACSLLAKKNNSVSVRLVDMVSTHLGNGDLDRDLQSLALLTSVAPYVEYGDISFVIDYYYKLSSDETIQISDNRLMSLTLELIGSWCQFATTEQRTLLRVHLVKCLAEGKDDGCRIGSATLAAQLDPTNLQWATELMQLSEMRALNGGDVSEWLRAADLSLVAEVDPSPQLIQLFLSCITRPIEVSECLAGLCVAGVGRLALRSRAAADLAAPVLAALLATEPSMPPAPLTPRVNALLVLTDICTRYTSIVEPLLESVCGCLEPTSPPALRRSAARALTRLFLAGYLRLRTPLYFGFCALLADDDPEVREPAEYYVTCCLTSDAIYHHFVDCVIYYNKEAAGALSFDARQLIYDVMLQRLSLVQRLNVQCRLAREVLEHAADMVDEGEEITQAMHASLLDTITLLCGPRMKLPKKPDKPGEDIDDLQERVTTNIVSHKMKCTVAEVLVPAVLRLYGKLRAGGGQLAAYLVRIANELLHDYRPEIEELIENDEELVTRVQHFQETIGQEMSFGNSRNLVTTSAPPEPETPRAPRRRAPRGTRSPVRKRALRI